MQASGRATKRVTYTSIEVFEVQNDLLEIFGIAGESMKGPWYIASLNNGVANLGRKAFDMLRVIAIFASTAAFR
jgi:hypothetical protein